jgi:spore germination protein KC
MASTVRGGLAGMAIHKRYRVIIACLPLIFLCGCWDIKNIDQRALPVVAGISLENDKQLKVTLQIPIPEQKKNKSRIVTGKGESVSSILGKLRMNSEKAIDYSHIRLIIFHDNLAKNNEQLSEIIKYLLVSKELPSRMLVAIADDPIEQLLSNINDKLGVNATSIYDYFNKGAGWTPDITEVRIWEIYQSLFSYTKDITVPIVSSGEDTVLKYMGSAVMSKGSIIERISPDESLLINLFQKQATNGKVESLELASVMITGSSIKLKTSMNNDIPQVSSLARFKIRILERKEGVSDHLIERELEKMIENRFKQMFEQAQKNHADVFGFGQYFRHQLPYVELENWRATYYPKLNVNFNVQASLE